MQRGNSKRGNNNTNNGGNNGGNGGDNGGYNQYDDNNRRGGDSKDREQQARENREKLSRMFSKTAQRTESAPRLLSLVNWLKQSIEYNPNVIDGHKLDIVSISSEDRNIEAEYSAAVIIMSPDGWKTVVSHTLMLATDHRYTSNDPYIYQGMDISPLQVPSTIYDDVYRATVDTQVKKHIALKTQNDKSFETLKEENIRHDAMSASVIPPSFVIPSKDKESELTENPVDGLFVLAVESLSAFENWLDHDSSMVRFGEVVMANKDARVVANIDQSPNVEYDLLGNATRSDWCISLQITTKQRRERQYNSTWEERTSHNKRDNEVDREIVRVTGFTTPVYGTPDRDALPFAPKHNGIQFNITSIESESATPSPELFIYAIGSVSALTYRDMWVQNFKPALSSREPRLNIGSLFMELRDSKGVPEKRKTYGQNDYNLWIDDLEKLFGSRVFVSMDCHRTGPNAWIYDMFAETSGDDNKNIIEAANNLTDNRFDDFFQRGGIVDHQLTTRFYTGTYIDQRGLTRDIRDVDYLYLLNWSDADMSLDRARKWDSLREENDILSLFQRLEIVNEVLVGQDVKVQDIVDRVVFTPEFYEAIVSGLDESKLLPNPEGQYEDIRSRERTNINKHRASIDMQNINGGFRSGNSTRGHYYNRGTHSRY